MCSTLRRLDELGPHLRAFRSDLIHELVSTAAVPDRPTPIGMDGASVTFAEFDNPVRHRGGIRSRTDRGDRVAVIAATGRICSAVASSR